MTTTKNKMNSDKLDGYIAHLFNEYPDLDSVSVDPLGGVLGFEIMGVEFTTQEAINKYPLLTTFIELANPAIKKDIEYPHAIERPRVAPSPSELKALKPFEVYVFSTSPAGMLSTASARKAVQLGASRTLSKGIGGQFYAVPVFDEKDRLLPLQVIKNEISILFEYASLHQENRFLLSELCIGQKQHSLHDITSLMFPFQNARNVFIPSRVFTYMMDNWGKF